MSESSTLLDAASGSAIHELSARWAAAGRPGRIAEPSQGSKRRSRFQGSKRRTAPAAASFCAKRCVQELPKFELHFGRHKFWKVTRHKNAAHGGLFRIFLARYELNRIVDLLRGVVSPIRSLCSQLAS
eukprot:7282025-Prymnesium_polylepis.1